jgi:hypothetical protein
MRILPVFFLCMLALASCDTTDPVPVPGDEEDPSVVVLPALVQSFEFSEGLEDSLGFVFETSFNFSDRLAGFDSLAVRILGDWTIGQYEIVHNIEGHTFATTASMFLWVEARLVSVEGPGWCLESSLRFPEEGEYGRDSKFVGCCVDCYPAPEDLIGQEVHIELVFHKSSAPWYETIRGMTCDVREVRIEVINPRFLEE